MSTDYRDAFLAAEQARPGRVGYTGPPEATGDNPALELLALGPEELRARFRQVMERGIHGLSFSPYVDGQSPGIHIDEAQIRARLEIIRPHTSWIRTFSCRYGKDAAARVAHDLGLQTLVGVELGSDREENERELAAGIATAQAGHVDILSVGNECLLREDLPPDELIGYMQRAREACPGVPVSYVDAYFLFENHPEVADACDVMLINCYPFWERCPLEHSLPYMQQMVRRTEAVAKGKEILISETGWPSAGSPFGGAVPGEDNALVYFLQTVEWVEREGLPLFWFAAFDENWKTGSEGDVGSSWGLWNSAGELKFS